MKPTCSDDEGARDISRRRFLRDCGLGAGQVALASVLSEKACASEPGLGSKPPFTTGSPKAKHVIFLFMAGGPSQLDLFDHKPALQRYQGQPMPAGYLKGQRYGRAGTEAALLASPFRFARFGESGAEMSELLPHLAKAADDLAIVRSVYSGQFNHGPAQEESTGLGGANANARPSTAVRNDALPEPIVLVSGNAVPLAGIGFASGRTGPGSSLLDLSRESPATLARYGAHRDQVSFARNCLAARRLVEAGARFVVCRHGSWDHHAGLGEGLPAQCRQTDRPCAALLQDLKSRGLLEETLVVWGGEFGRTPTAEPAPGLAARPGRGHHPHAFTLWLAGGGIKGGQTIGATDELGFHPVERPIRMRDIHATIRHLLCTGPATRPSRDDGSVARAGYSAGTVVPELLA